MLNLGQLGGARPYIAWKINAAGRAEAGNVLTDAQVRTLVANAADGLVLAITVLSGGAAEMLARYTSLLDGGDDAGRVGDARPLTGPFVVPKSWSSVPLGAEGFVVGDLTNDAPDRLPLVLGAWPVTFEQLKHFGTALEAVRRQWPITTPAHARTRLERLVPIEDLSERSLTERVRDGLFGPSEAVKLDYAGAIRRCEQIVDRYEDDFRSGHDFTREQHIRIEQLLQELIMRRGAFRTGALETERLGLESRLVRLLNAQSSRHASGALQRVLAALTAVVLVPTLVAGVFGANVPLPFEKAPAMRTAMFALMACAGALSYLLLHGVRQTSSERGLSFAWPGDKPPTGPDGAWLGRLLFVAIAAGALDVAVEAWVQMHDVDGMAWSTTGETVLLAGVVVALCLIVLAVREACQRGWRVAAAVGVGAVSAAAVSALLRTDIPWALDKLW